MSEELRKQVALQCKAVAHMATALAEVHTGKAALFETSGGSPAIDRIAEHVGHGTAQLMEMLGDILNGMDAVDEKEDAWIDPVFKEAQRRWLRKA